jgi:CII-binding regulator of phage lambda lysogenization HflD
MEDYISLTEAAASTGKSEMTIRRLSKKPIADQHIKKINGIILIRRDFVKSIYPFDNNNVIIDNKAAHSAINDDNTTYFSNEALNNEILILKAKLEGKEELLQSQKQYIDLLEQRFKDYQEEKQKELDRLHERWSQEQEIFKRDQHLNAGKYIIQKNQELPGSIEDEEKKSLWKRIFG